MESSSNSKGQNKEEAVCGFCYNAITPEQVAENFCPQCNTAYCSEHFAWSEWSYVHLVTETMIRYGTCPYGHKKEELDS